MLRRAQRGEIPPARQVNRRVPAALEAVCRKAMATKPQDRYPSARALGEEVERWLADEPVSAYRDPLTVRLVRWGRRHRTAAVGGGALLVAAVLALAVGAMLIGREQARTEAKAEELRRRNYIHPVNRAQQEVRDDDIARGEQYLDDCPPDLRGWEWHYVRRLGHLDRLTYTGHGTRVQGLAVSPDGAWIASGAGPAYDDALADFVPSLRAWEAATGRERVPLDVDGLNGTVHDVAISPDGARIAARGGYYKSLGPDGKPRPDVRGWVALWDAATGRRLWARPVPGKMVTDLAFGRDRDGPMLVVGHGTHLYAGLNPVTGTVFRYDLATGEEAPLLPEFAAGIHRLALHPDGQHIAVIPGQGDRLELWDRETRAKVRGFDLEDARLLYCLTLNSDGSRLAAGAWDRVVRVWETATGRVMNRFYGHRSFVLGVAFSPDDRGIASAGEDKSVRLWDDATGRERAAFHGHTHFIYDVAFLPDGRSAASASLDRTVKIWNLSPGHPITLRGHEGWVSDVAFAADGSHVATRHDARRIDAVNGVSIGRDETKVWHAETGREVPSRVGSASDEGPTFGPWGRLGDFTATSPDGRLVATRSAENSNHVDVKDAATGRILYTLKGHTERITDIAFSPGPGPRRIATSSWDGSIKIWDAGTGLEALTLRGHTAGVNCVAFSPQGDRIISGSIDMTAILWDARP